ncbi:MAG TPA: ATP-binding protein [Bryobacteraceae bacterium]|nr:ATP-binding protein [Bryobacteraceae bacterium]
MKRSRTRAGRQSLAWRILLSTSIAITLLFAITGWAVQSYAARVSQQSLEAEVKISLRAYEALWAVRVNDLAAISRIMSSMSDVRAAFMTHDSATIRDTAGQLWSQVSAQDASFLVLDPAGGVIASLGGELPDLAGTDALLKAATARFPAQSSAYVAWDKHLYYVVLTPVYVQTATEPALLNVLLVAFAINDKLALEMKKSTDGTDFAFLSASGVVATTVPVAASRELLSGMQSEGGTKRQVVAGTDSLVLRTPLTGPDGTGAGTLYIIRSFAGPTRVIMELRKNIALIWVLAMLTGILLTYLLTKRILRPVETLDRAAEEVTRRNYGHRVPVETQDELGRLATTFNAMCDSIQNARDELIRHERIATIGRLSTSIVHDLRNPLAAIYGGAEMLVDAELSPEHSRRLASNIYLASRRIQELLQELVDVSRSNGRPLEMCKLLEIVNGAVEPAAGVANAQRVSVAVDVPADIRVMADHDRLGRVFFNLIDNALDAMPEGGALRISCSVEPGSAIVHIEDTGRGISEEAWQTLFQPFSSFGKKSGLGLGLALARQTMLDHGGEMWADRNMAKGARFHLRLKAAASQPLQR